MQPAAVLSLVVRSTGTKLVASQLFTMDAAAKKSAASLTGVGTAAEGAAAKQGLLASAAGKGRSALAASSRAAGFTAVAVAGIGAAAVKAAANYESSMNTLQAVSGATREEMSKLSKLSIKLGADVRLPGTSAQDAAEAMTEMIKAGVSLQDTMAGVRSVLVLSAAAGVSNAEAAEIASNALNAFKLQGKDVAMVADQLANTANASSVEIRDVADAMKMAAAVFSGFQAPVLGAKGALTELNVAVGLLGNAGIKGSDAGTSLKQTLLQLTGPSDKSKTAMKGLYLAAQNAAGSQSRLSEIIRGSAKDRNTAVKEILKMNPALKDSGDIAYDSAGKMRSLKDIIRLTALGTKDMTQEQKNSYLTQIFGADATRTVIALMNAGPKAWDKMTASVTKQGAAQALADAKMKGFKGSIEALKSTLETLAITFGTVLLPALTGALKGFTNLLSAVDPKVLGLVVAAIGGVSAAVWLLNAALSANPVVLLVAALALLTAGLITAYQKSAAFRDVVNSVWAALQAGAGGAVQGVTAAIAGVQGAVHAAVAEFNKWKVAQAVVTTAFNAIKAYLTPAMAAITSIIKVGLAFIGPAFKAAFGVISAVVRGAFNALKAIVEGGLQVLHGIVQVFGGLLKGDFSQMWTGVKNIFKGAIHAFGGLIMAEVNTVKDAAMAIGKGIIDGVKNGLSMLGHEILNRFKDAAKFVAREVGGLFSGIGGAITKGIGSINPFGDGPGKEALPTVGSANLMGARSQLGPFASMGAKLGLHVSSGLRPGATTAIGASYHASGEAIDVAGPAPGMLKFFKTMRSRFGSRLAELIYTPGGTGIKDGQPHTYTGKVAADHFDHVHLALDLGRPGVGDGPGKARAAAGKFIGDGPGIAIRAARNAGFTGEALVRAVAIAGRESNYNSHAKNLKPPDHSIGLWQINQLAHHGRFGSDKELENPDTNARAAWILSGHGTNWGPWSTNRGLGKAALDKARAAIKNYKGGGVDTAATTAGKTGAAKVSKLEQQLAAADLGIAEAGRGKTIKVGGVGGRKVGPALQKIAALTAKRSVISARIKKIRGALKGKLTPATRLRLTQELTQRLGEHADIQGQLRELRAPAAAAATDTGGGGGGVDTGGGEDPNQPLIDAINTAAEQQRIHDELIKQQIALQELIRDEQRKFATVSSSQYGVLAKAIADVASGQIGGKIGLGFMTPGFAGGGSRY